MDYIHIYIGLIFEKGGCYFQLQPLGAVLEPGRGGGGVPSRHAFTKSRGSISFDLKVSLHL